MTQTTLTALYDTRGDADTAAARLVTEVGLAQSDITVIAQETGQEAAVPEEGGFFASLKALFMPERDHDTYAEALRRGGFLLTAQAEQRSAEQAMDILEEHGAVDLDQRRQAWQATGSSVVEASPGTMPAPGDVPAATPIASASGALPAGQEDKIDLVEETLRIGKRVVGGGRVRVRSYVIETPIEEQVSLHQEHIDVERRPMDRAPTPADEVLFSERVIEATETGEEAVITKEARVVEEVTLRKDSEERVETVHDTVRHTEIETDDTRSPHANDTMPASGPGHMDPAPRR